jgi:molybdopterin converting factor small subunit
MIVNIPGPLRSYTAGLPQVEAEGETLGALLQDLDARYPGIRFRMIDEQDGIRPHIRFFVDSELVFSYGTALTEHSIVHIICAISGGNGT